MQELVEQLGWVPRTCVWEITRACNLHCGHCGSSAGKPRRDELSTAECCRVIEDLEKLGNRHITLSGGEPTLRNDWPDLARFAVDRGIVVNLVTNGQTDARRLAATAGSAGLANVAVSLDGLEPTHDALRGPGTLRRATLAIETLVAAGVWVDVMVTVNRKNLDELEELHARVAALGAKRFRVQLGKPMGNQTHRPDLTLVPRQLLDLMPLLGRLNGRGGVPVRLGDSIGFYSSEERRLRGDYCAQECWTGCYAGCQAIGIQSDGGIKGCLSLQPRFGEPDPFVEGNVREESLRDIWLGPGRFAYNRAPLHDLDDECGHCGHRSLCRGGAKCVAYAFTGAMAHNPMCYLSVVRSSPCSIDRPGVDRIWPPAGAAGRAALLAGITLMSCGGESESDPASGGQGGSSAGAATTGGVAATGSVSATGGLSAPGGRSQGGALASGGQLVAGGRAQGGDATGGFGSGGRATGGIRATGGAAVDGGRSAYGGGPQGGAASPGGQVASAGHAQGGVVTGGVGTGGVGTGGVGTGGVGTGGVGTGGVGTGGVGTGGVGTGGAATGGTATGGGSPGDAGTDGIDCQTVCCMCDYGIIPPEYYAACC